MLGLIVGAVIHVLLFFCLILLLNYDSLHFEETDSILREHSKLGNRFHI